MGKATTESYLRQELWSRLSPLGRDYGMTSDIQRTISDSLDKNEQLLSSLFHNCSDVKFRKITVQDDVILLFIYVDGMINADILTSNIMKPLLYEGLPQGLESIRSVAQMLEREHFSALQTRKLTEAADIADCILKGELAVIADGEREVLLIDASQYETRAIIEPSGESALRGSRESFTEQLRTNTSMLRRIFTTPDLKLESFTVGKLTKTEVVMAYIEGVASEAVVEEVRTRIDRIELDGVLESGYIEESIEETHLSPFPQILSSERPDVVSSALMEGRVAILTGGSPIALIVPMTFWAGLQAPDDYFERTLFVSLNRWIRYCFALMSVLLPSIYIALTNFHPEMVPTKLMLSIASLRERAPFPTVIEVILMESVFEGLREAGIRLPKQIGPLVSIVGALVIGEAAVRAGIISAPIVIIVSAAGIASFVIPRYSFSFPLRMIRFPLAVLSGLFGLFGTAIGIMTILIHLIGLRSFGVPYLSPIAPVNGRKLKDVLMRWPRKLTVHSGTNSEADHP